MQESGLSFRQLESGELRLALTLAAVIGTRMLGLFLILPVFMLLATEVPGYTPALAGLAIGIYGLTQALLQQPFGHLSDHWGRRRVILLGLSLFIMGSVFAALAETMWALIAGRALQGCGAIAGVTLAFAADHTHPDRRPTAMALIGMAIGSAFLISIMVSVPLASVVGLSGLFWITCGLGVLGVLLVLKAPSGPPIASQNLQVSQAPSGIWTFCFSVFLLHALMTLLFVVLPGLLVERQSMELAQHWKIYVPTMLVSAILVFPLLRVIAARNIDRHLLPWGFVGLAIPFALFYRDLSMPVLMATAVLYFIAFNLLEALMPSMVSRLYTESGRGRKMGLYTTFQFLGAFAGGVAGGWLLQVVGAELTMLYTAIVCMAWAWVSRILLRGQNARP
jgi:MFS family permease